MVYIHVPYCRSFCTYCGFYSEIPGKGFGRFTDALCAEISYRRNEIAASCRCCNFVCTQESGGCAAGPDGHAYGSRDFRSNTLYIGGGTPSILPLSDLERIVESVGEAAGLPLSGELPFDEFTVEVNPDDIVSKGPGYVEGLLSLGVNRVSMGVQAMDDNVLNWMNRRHDVETARKAYRIISSAGIGNISIDLIFGYALDAAGGPGHWEKTVSDALSIAGDGTVPKHISAYQLSVDEGSALAGMVASGRYVEAPDEQCAQQYAVLCSLLADAGYRHYEISNFAQPGYEAKHNSAYWNHVPYVGLGPAAHSFSGSGPGMSPRRTWNHEDTMAYISAAEKGDWSRAASGETLDGRQLREEEIMLSLRTDKGISRKYLEMDRDIVPSICRFLSSGSLVPVDPETMEYYGLPAGEERLRIPEERFFVSDDIISELL